MLQSSSSFKCLFIKEFYIASMEFQPTSRFEILELSVDNLARAAKLGGQLLVCGFKAEFIISEFEQMAGQPNIEFSEGDFFNQGDQTA